MLLHARNFVHILTKQSLQEFISCFTPHVLEPIGWGKQVRVEKGSDFVNIGPPIIATWAGESRCFFRTASLIQNKVAALLDYVPEA